MTTPKRILVLIHQPKSVEDKNWHDFQQKLHQHMGDDYVVTMGALVDLTFVLTRDNLDVYDAERDFSLADFDLVVFRNLKKDFIRTSACVSFLRGRGTPYIDSRLEPRPLSKFCAQAIRQQVDMPIIQSVFSSSARLLAMIAGDALPFPYPVIIKDDNGKKGQNNFLAPNKDAATDIITRHPDVSFIVQEYIRGDGDYRFLVMGTEVALVIHRRAQNTSHLNNTSQGASSAIIPVDSFSRVILDDVIKAAQLEHIEMAGVDVIVDSQTGQHYIIEVNSSPQITTGAFPDLKTAAVSHYLRSLLDR